MVVGGRAMRSLFIGRWQPFHKGHRKLIDKVLGEGKPVVIAVRDTPVSEENPYTVGERVEMIKDVYGGKVEVVVIPDIAEVCFGRKVGWRVRRVRLDSQTEEISATRVRNSQKRVIWLTGNMGSGKTSIAYLLKERLNAVVLDGDEMRVSISLGAGFSKKDRDDHNLRVARLAQVLNEQGHNVVVSVIAPFRSTRSKIDRICRPYWIYIKGGETGRDKPYEVPEDPGVVIDPSEESLLESVGKIVKEVGGIRMTGGGDETKVGGGG
jgi:cytidyltransferase-like protein